MKIKTAKFIISAEKLSQCPEFNLPEFALLGRSNVGKSSFINALCRNNKLAKTSNTPGKTRLINYFNISDLFMIADLPGYGYARISKETQAKWQKNLEEYLLNRKSLTSLIQFIDARHDVQKNDLQMREWINYHNLPIITVLTKVDYIKRNEINKKLREAEKLLGSEAIPFSTKISQYNDNILNKISELISSK